MAAGAGSASVYPARDENNTLKTNEVSLTLLSVAICEPIKFTMLYRLWNPDETFHMGY